MATSEEPRSALDKRRNLGSIFGLALLALVFFVASGFPAKTPLAVEYQRQMQPWLGDRRPWQIRRQWAALVWDGVAQYYPWRLHLHRCVERGELPLWNPHQFCGTPFVANGQSAVFYPPNVLFWFLSPAPALALNALLHVVWAGLGAWLFLRRLGIGRAAAWAGAVSYMFSGFLVSWMELASPFAVACWFPWGLWGVHRLAARATAWRAATLGAICGIGVLGGHFQIAAYLLLVTGLYGAAYLGWKLWRRDAGWWRYAFGCVGAAVLALSLACAQVLPSVELARMSHRPLGRPDEGGFQWQRSRALRGYELVLLLAPNALGRPADGDYLAWLPDDAGAVPGSYSEHCGYAGAAAAFLAIVGLVWGRSRHRYFLAALAAGAVLVSSGGPVARLFYFHVPGVAQAGGLARALSVYALGVALLAAIGLNEILGAGCRRARPGALGPTLVAGVMLAVLVVLLWKADETYRLMKRLPAISWEQPVLRAGAVAFAIIGVTTAVVWLRDRGRLVGAVAPLLCGLVAFDGLLFAWNVNPWGKSSEVYAVHEVVDVLRRTAGDGRVLARTPKSAWSFSQDHLRPLLPPNAALAYGLYGFQGYDSLYIARFKNYAGLIEHDQPAPPENGNMILVGRVDSPLLDLAGVRAIASLDRLFDARLRPVEQSGPVWVYENMRAARA